MLNWSTQRSGQQAFNAGSNSRHHNYHRRVKEAQVDLRKTRLCPSLSSKQGCPFSAEECRFAHSPSELRLSFDKYYKVHPCAFYAQGKCRNGDFCRFAHGADELRGRLNQDAEDTASNASSSWTNQESSSFTSQATTDHWHPWKLNHDSSKSTSAEWPSPTSTPASRMVSLFTEEPTCEWNMCNSLSPSQIEEGLSMAVVYED